MIWDHIANQKKMVAIFLVLGKMVAILFRMVHHWKTECHWKTKKRATIGIPNASGIPAPHCTRMLNQTDKKNVTI